MVHGETRSDFIVHWLRRRRGRFRVQYGRLRRGIAQPQGIRFRS
jgi:hypothetical protein